MVVSHIHLGVVIQLARGTAGEELLIFICFLSLRAD